MVCVIRHSRLRDLPAIETAPTDQESERAERAKRRSPFLSNQQAAFYLSLTTRTLEQMRKDGRGPIFRRHGRFIRYHISDLDDWSQGLSRYVIAHE